MLLHLCLLRSVETSPSFNHSRAPEPQSRPPSAAAAAVVVVGDRSDARDNVINVNNKDEGALCARAALPHSLQVSCEMSGGRARARALV